MLSNFIANMAVIVFQEEQTNKGNAENELAKLRAKVRELEGDNSAILVENTDLNERINTLLSELSIKEAKWCEAEEQYKLKVM